MAVVEPHASQVVRTGQVRGWTRADIMIRWDGLIPVRPPTRTSVIHAAPWWLREEDHDSYLDGYIVGFNQRLGEEASYVGGFVNLMP